MSNWTWNNIVKECRSKIKTSKVLSVRAVGIISIATSTWFLFATAGLSEIALYEKKKTNDEWLKPFVKDCLTTDLYGSYGLEHLHGYI